MTVICGHKKVVVISCKLELIPPVLVCQVVRNNQNHNYGYRMAQRLEKCVQGELHSSIHFYWGLSMSSHQNWFISCAFKSAGPRLLQMRPNAAKNFKCAFNTSSFYWRFGANLSVLFLPFRSPPQMFVWGCQRVCTCACLEASSIYFLDRVSRSQ